MGKWEFVFLSGGLGQSYTVYTFKFNSTFPEKSLPFILPLVWQLSGSMCEHGVFFIGISCIPLVGKFFYHLSVSNTLLKNTRSIF